MIKILRPTLVTCCTIILVACASTPDKMVDLKVGMSKSEAMSIMGKPTSVSRKEDAEYLSYELCVFNCMAPPLARRFNSFYVRLVNDRVESFGRAGDFDSAKTPTTRIEIDRNDRITQDVRMKQNDDLYTELKKLKELLDSGVLTQEEFDTRKKILLSK